MQPGQQITPTLRLRSMIGKGGMGSVWTADHLALGTEVAVKFMSAGFVENASLVQRFRTEAMAAAQIKSPHVAQVFDHGFMTDGTPYIVMELLEGEDLKRRIRQEGPLPLKDVAHIISQACKALGRAHTLGIVHRDIKPDNIFLCNLDGETFVKVLDFGIAKVGPDSALGATTTGSMMGTPLYMSPEQLLSAKRVDLRSDLWSLAVVAYHAITARVPFHGETVGSLSVAVHTGTFVPPSAVRPDVTPALDAWFLKALRRDPNERFGSAKELSDALDQAISGASAASLARPMMPSHYDMGGAPTSGPMGMTPQPTLGGTSSTAARTSGSKKPALLAAGAGLFAVMAIIAVILARSGGAIDEDATRAAATRDSPAVEATPATPPPTPAASPMVAPVVAPEQPIASAAAPAATTQAAATTKSEPKTTIKTPPPPPSATTKKTVKPTGDSIGF